ncbi:MAG: peptide deformylase [Oscillospiraceae bacterium]
MAFREVITEKDETLRKKSKTVDRFDEKLHILLDDLAETMYKYQGVGLASVQVGVLKRALVVDVGEGIIELINPEIVKATGKQEESEGCLSCPDEYGLVERPARVEVKAQNRYGECFQVTGVGLLARALCHEIDHLDGIIFKDIATQMLESDSPKPRRKKLNVHVKK